MKAASIIERVRLRAELPPPAMRRAIRLAARESLRTFGEAMSPRVSPTAIYHWERGQRMPQGHHLNQYCDLLRALACHLEHNDIARHLDEAEQ